MSDARPPIARRIRHVALVHGEPLEDDYFWLREKADPAVAAYLEAENAHTEAATAHLAGLHQRRPDAIAQVAVYASVQPRPPVEIHSLQDAGGGGFLRGDPAVVGEVFDDEGAQVLHVVAAEHRAHFVA